MIAVIITVINFLIASITNVGYNAHMPQSKSELLDIADVRERIVAAALDLLSRGGQDALTTRAVSEAAGVQAPAIYRLFGDKAGLLDAAAERGLAAYVVDKAALKPRADPLEDLRESWDRHIAFSLDNPALFAILSGQLRQNGPSAAAAAGMDVLRRRVRRLALAGILCVPESRAVLLLHGIGTGIILTLLNTPLAERDASLATVAREAAIAAITTAEVSRDTHVPAAAVMLKASLADSAVISPGERLLMEELLDRLART
jgi:AcrR family transcriptional regulator